jgi:hypothetical protein
LLSKTRLQLADCEASKISALEAASKQPVHLQIKLEEESRIQATSNNFEEAIKLRTMAAEAGSKERSERAESINHEFEKRKALLNAHHEEQIAQFVEDFDGASMKHQLEFNERKDQIQSKFSWEINILKSTASIRCQFLEPAMENFVKKLTDEIDAGVESATKAIEGYELERSRKEREQSVMGRAVVKGELPVTRARRIATAVGSRPRSGKRPFFTTEGAV